MKTHLDATQLTNLSFKAKQNLHTFLLSDNEGWIYRPSASNLYEYTLTSLEGDVEVEDGDLPLMSISQLAKYLIQNGQRNAVVRAMDMVEPVDYMWSIALPILGG